MTVLCLHTASERRVLLGCSLHPSLEYSCEPRETDGNVNARDAIRERGGKKGGNVIASDESLPHFLSADVCVSLPSGEINI